MEPLEVKGQLLKGIEYGGKWHKDFTLRPLYVRDSIRAHELAEKRVPAYVDVVLLSMQLEQLGEIPKKDITPALLENVLDEDFMVFVGARMLLQKKTRALAAPPTAKKHRRQAKP